MNPCFWLPAEHQLLEDQERTLVRDPPGVWRAADLLSKPQQ